MDLLFVCVCGGGVGHDFREGSNKSKRIRHMWCFKHLGETVIMPVIILNQNIN